MGKSAFQSECYSNQSHSASIFLYINSTDKFKGHSSSWNWNLNISYTLILFPASRGHGWAPDLRELGGQPRYLRPRQFERPGPWPGSAGHQEAAGAECRQVPQVNHPHSHRPRVLRQELPETVHYPRMLPGIFRLSSLSSYLPSIGSGTWNPDKGEAGWETITIITSSSPGPLTSPVLGPRLLPWPRAPGRGRGVHRAQEEGNPVPGTKWRWPAASAEYAAGALLSQSQQSISLNTNSIYRRIVATITNS